MRALVGLRSTIFEPWAPRGKPMSSWYCARHSLRPCSGCCAARRDGWCSTSTTPDSATPTARRRPPGWRVSRRWCAVPTMYSPATTSLPHPRRGSIQRSPCCPPVSTHGSTGLQPQSPRGAFTSFGSAVDRHASTSMMQSPRCVPLPQSCPDFASRSSPTSIWWARVFQCCPCAGLLTGRPAPWCLRTSGSRRCATTIGAAASVR